MSGEKVSLIVWSSPRDRDPRLPVDDRAERDLLILWHDGRITTKRTVLIGEAELGRMAAWSELPAPSEATLDDLHEAVSELRTYTKYLHDYGLDRSAFDVDQFADRIRALVPEETDHA